MNLPQFNDWGIHIRTHTEQVAILRDKSPDGVSSSRLSAHSSGTADSRDDIDICTQHRPLAPSGGVDGLIRLRCHRISDQYPDLAGAPEQHSVVPESPWAHLAHLVI